MTDSARQARNEYMRAWRAKNKEKEKATREAYWERKAREEAAKNGKTAKA